MNHEHKFTLAQRFAILLTGRATLTLPDPAPRPAPAQPSPIQHWTSLDLSTWRSSPTRVTFAKQLFDTPLFRELVSMLASIRPAARGPLDPTAAAIQLGRRQGHDDILAALQAATTPLEPITEDPQPDYGTSEQDWTDVAAQ